MTKYLGLLALLAIWKRQSSVKAATPTNVEFAFTRAGRHPEKEIRLMTPPA